MPRLKARFNFSDFIVHVVAALMMLVGSAALSPSHAQGDAAAYAKALTLFAQDSFNDTDAAVATIGASGHPNAEPIVRGLQDGRLLFSADTKKVFLKDAAGTLTDLATGEKVSPEPAGLSNVRLNNRVRRGVEAALGSLTLMSPDVNRRLEAAAAVFKSKDAGALPALDAALAKEADPRVKKLMREARAAIVLYGASFKEGEKGDALALLRDRGDQDARGVIAAMPAEQPDSVKRMQVDAIAAIDKNLAAWEVAQNFWYGLSLGSVLLLAAIGLAITFGVMGVINMAHGEMVMLGAYTTFVVQEIIRTKFPGLFDYSLAIAIPLAFLVAGAVGIAIERGVIRFLYGRPLETLLATWGISLILQQAVRTAFGPTNREVGAPHFMSGSVQLAGLTVTWNRLWIIVFAVLIFTALLAALRYTTLGLQMRAVTQNRRMASAMAIHTGRIDALTFALGSGIAGLAGVALSQIDNVSPNLGQGYIIDSFLVVVFGGVGNLWGTLVGALSLGIANKFLEPYAGAVLGKILLLVAVILFIQKRPRGLFALKGRAVEA
jgi:urea transport system permease protein